MIRIAVFASGNGTNAENIIKYFRNSTLARVVLVLTNNKDAKVLKKATKLSINTLGFSREELYSSDKLSIFLKKEVDFIVLAGFLWKIPANILSYYPNRIINIHPALLPKYGGKGMFGHFVHEAVINNNEKKSGITIHYVNENYDEGSIIFQKKIKILINDTSDDLALKIHQLEQENFPIVIENILKKQVKEKNL